jgi:hypothetical protein
MRRHEEIMDPDSCFNKALPDELMFVLLERDEAAPYAVEEWARKRIELGLNSPDDLKILSALQWAKTVKERQVCLTQSEAKPT